MTRRVHVPQLHVGEMELPANEAHHLRDVLRLGERAEVSLFDDGGRAARGVVVECSTERVVVRVDQVEEVGDAGGVARVELIVASAVPKAARADWMIEKLSELGVSTFVPLATARSVVHPEGKGKLDRWNRIAVEAAKQSRRSGIMRIGPLVSVQEAIRQMPGVGWYLSTASDAVPVAQVLAGRALTRGTGSLTLFIGPEGGWTGQETQLLAGGGLTAVALTATILRIETAAVAAAAIVSAWAAGRPW